MKAHLSEAHFGGGRLHSWQLSQTAGDSRRRVKEESGSNVMSVGLKASALNGQGRGASSVRTQVIRVDSVLGYGLRHGPAARAGCQLTSEAGL